MLAELMADRSDPDTVGAGRRPLGLGATGKPTFNRLWTLLGTPCVNVPGIVASSGLPLGVQIVGRFGRDKAALAGARVHGSSAGSGNTAKPMALQVFLRINSESHV